jgi:hypothetical protein
LRIGIVTSAVLALSILSASVPLFAHHGNAIYDSKKSVTMKATVTEWWWANPHCLLMYDAKGDDGQVNHWVVETSAPVNIIPNGWSKNSLKPGDVVTVTIEPAKNGKPIGRIESVTLPDGKILIGAAAEHFVQKDVDEGHTK